MKDCVILVSSLLLFAGHLFTTYCRMSRWLERAGGFAPGLKAGRADGRTAGSVGSPFSRLRVLVKFWLAPTLRAQAVKVAQMPTLRVHGRHALHGDESSQPTLVRREAETKRDERTSEPSATVGLFATFFATAPHTRACGQKCF